MCLDLANSRHLAPGFVHDDVPHGGYELRCRIQRILPLVHRGCARVIGETENGDIPALDADNAVHDADLNVFAVQNSALFDV